MMGKMNIITLPYHKDFPVIKTDIDDENCNSMEFSISSQLLLEMINLTVSVTLSDKSHPIIPGVYFESKSGFLGMGSSNNSLENLKVIKLDKKLVNFETIIPVLTIITLKRLINQEEPDEVVIRLSENKQQALFEINDTRIVSQVWILNRQPKSRQKPHYEIRFFHNQNRKD